MQKESFFPTVSQKLPANQQFSVFTVLYILMPLSIRFRSLAGSLASSSFDLLASLLHSL